MEPQHAATISTHHHHDDEQQQHIFGAFPSVTNTFAPSGFPQSTNNTILMSTLQHLSSFAGGAGTSSPTTTYFAPQTAQTPPFAPSASSHLAFGTGQQSSTIDFGTNNHNDYWRNPSTSSSSSAWFDQANKMAAVAAYHHQATMDSGGDFRSATNLSSTSIAQPSHHHPVVSVTDSSMGSVPSNFHHQHQSNYPTNTSTRSDYANIAAPIDPTFGVFGQLDDLTNWTKDIDLADFNALSSMDLFIGGTGGASSSDKCLPDDAIHSVLEYDPSALTGIYSGGSTTTPIVPVAIDKGTPPASSSTSSSSTQQQQHIVTPKLREKIKMRREKELADADKEFDRLLSLVAEKNAHRPSIDGGQQTIPLPVDIVPSDHSITLRNNNNINLSPVRFTPPDSPTETTTESSSMVHQANLIDAESSGAAVMVYVPKVDNRSIKSNKVPIYKMAAANSVFDESKNVKRTATTTSFVETNRKAPNNDDEYSFIDDDDNFDESNHNSSSSQQQQQPVPVDRLKEQKLEAEVAQKLARISTMHPELRTRGGSRPFIPGGTTAKASDTSHHPHDLWRHVVPKKRHTTSISSLDRPAVPSTPLLPPPAAAVPIADAASPLPAPPPLLPQLPTSTTAAQQLADTLRRRREHRSNLRFVRTELCLDDTSTAKSSAPQHPVGVKDEVVSDDDIRMIESRLPVSADAPMMVPKVIIRIPKRCITQPSDDSIVFSKKKKKKHHRGDDEAGHHHRRKKKHHRHRHHHRSDDTTIDSNRLVSPTMTASTENNDDDDDEEEEEEDEVEDPLWKPSCSSKSASAGIGVSNTVIASGTAVYNKKKRLMQWNEDTTASVGHRDEVSSGGAGKHKRHKKLRRGGIDGKRSGDGDGDCGDVNVGGIDDGSADVDLRLSHFSLPLGTLQKGTFVVNKQDILKSDCPLWRVDNQNLLQKFPPAPHVDGTTRVIYKNSSTYSGWCDKFSDSYLVVQVRFLKHTRSETLVEPEIPLVDLFPAINIESMSGGELVSGGALSPPECDQHLQQQQMPLREAMETYLQALLHHAMTGTFLQTIKLGNDWKFLRHMNDVDRLNIDRQTKLLSRVQWHEQFEELVNWYPLCSIGDAEGHGLMCQACGGRSIDKVVQLFANEGYDYESLESLPMRCSNSGSPIPSMEYLVCLICANATSIYHRLHHMRYHVYKRCEDKIEFLRDENVQLEPTAILDLCIKNRSWINNIIQEYLDMWKKVADNGF